MSSESAKIGAFRIATRPMRRAIRLAWRRRAAERARRRSAATFVAVTGSSAKSTTTALLAHILEHHGRVSKLVIHNTMESVMPAIARIGRRDDYVVHELGVGGPGDMGPLAALFRPDVAIVTYAGLEHYTAFRGREAVATEKGGLVEAVRPGGFALLNADDENVMGMAKRTRERIVTFGREREADYRAVSVSFRFPGPLIVDIAARGRTERIVVGLVGEQFWLSATAAFAAARELGVPVETIAAACATFRPLTGRSELIKVSDGPLFLLDTVKAPWETFELAMRMIEGAEAPRKRIVIGQISDYTGSSTSKYRQAYRMAREIADRVIFVGDIASKHKADAEDRSRGLITEVATARELHDHLRRTATAGEIILMKSAQNLHLERAALAFERDVQCWVNKCGVKRTCTLCGMYAYPFEQHGAVRKQQRRARRLYRLLPFLRPAPRGD